MVNYRHLMTGHIKNSGVSVQSNTTYHIIIYPKTPFIGCTTNRNMNNPYELKYNLRLQPDVVLAIACAFHRDPHNKYVQLYTHTGFRRVDQPSQVKI